MRLSTNPNNNATFAANDAGRRLGSFPAEAGNGVGSDAVIYWNWAPFDYDYKLADPCCSTAERDRRAALVHELAHAYQYAIGHALPSPADRNVLDPDEIEAVRIEKIIRRAKQLQQRDYYGPFQLPDYVAPPNCPPCCLCLESFINDPCATT